MIPLAQSLAWQLANAARMVTLADAKNISWRIEYMETILDQYDNEIFNNCK